jgi:hypothetical protein
VHLKLKQATTVTNRFANTQVTSSCLGKKAEGVAQRLLRGLQVEPAPVLHGLQVEPVPVLVESVKDGIEDLLHAPHVGEQDHAPGAPADVHEAGSVPGVDWVVTGPTPLVFV